MTTKFTKDHEYVSVAGDTGTVGITVYAQEQLGDVVFVELPEIGRDLKAGDEAAVVESVKAASEIYAPVSGTVTEVNTRLADEPGLINQDAAGEGWLFKLTLSENGELDALLDETAYAEHAK